MTIEKEDALISIVGAMATCVSPFLKPGDCPDWKLFERMVSSYLDVYLSKSIKKKKRKNER